MDGSQVSYPDVTRVAKHVRTNSPATARTVVPPTDPQGPVRWCHAATPRGRSGGATHRPPGVGPAVISSKDRHLCLLTTRSSLESGSASEKTAASPGAATRSHAPMLPAIRGVVGAEMVGLHHLPPQSTLLPESTESSSAHWGSRRSSAVRHPLSVPCSSRADRKIPSHRAAH